MINKSENTLKDRLTAKIQEIERELNALKTRQLLGADNLVTTASTTTVDTFSLAHAQQNTLIKTITPTIPQLMFAEVAFTIYIGTDNDKTYRWPDGSNLTLDQVFGTVSAWRIDQSENDDTTGKKAFMLWVLNTGANTYTYYVHSKFYIPGVSVS